MTKKRITIGITNKGYHLGEGHHRAKLSDDDVELIRDLYEEELFALSALAKVFGVGKSTIYDIVTFKKRANTPAAYKTLQKGNVPKSRLEQLGYDRGVIDEDFDDR